MNFKIIKNTTFKLGFIFSLVLFSHTESKATSTVIIDLGGVPEYMLCNYYGIGCYGTYGYFNDTPTGGGSAVSLASAETFAMNYLYSEASSGGFITALQQAGVNIAAVMKVIFSIAINPGAEVTTSYMGADGVRVDIYYKLVNGQWKFWVQKGTHYIVAFGETLERFLRVGLFMINPGIMCTPQSVGQFAQLCQSLGYPLDSAIIGN